MKCRQVIFSIIPVLLLAACSAGNPEVPSDDIRWQQIETLFYEYKLKYFSKVPETTVDQIPNDLKNHDLIIIDVRSPEERAVSFIPGSITREEHENITVSKDTRIITYCTIGMRSGLYAKKLRDNGFNAYNLKGGVLAWAHQGRKFIDGNSVTLNRIHVYGQSWELVPEGYEAVW